MEARTHEALVEALREAISAVGSTDAESADELGRLCEQQSGNYDAFAFDPQALEGVGLDPATLDEAKMTSKTTWEPTSGMSSNTTNPPSG